MVELLYKKLGSITALPATKDNEIIIRNLTHRLLNEINQADFLSKYASDREFIRQNCLNCIRLLNNDIILKSEHKDYIFEKYNLTSVIRNTLTACDILLCKTDTEIVFDYYAELYIEFPLKLLMSAVIVIVRLFYQSFEGCEIYFTLKKNPHATVLLAECVNNKPKNRSLLSVQENVSVLKKIAEILGGAYLVERNDKSFICALSVRNREKSSGSVKDTPDYVELLIDKMSEVHIGLSGLNLV